MQKEFEKGVNFEFRDSLKNNGINYWLVLDDLCQEINNSKAFVEIVTARRHHALSILYSKRNLFLQSELGPGVELQKKPHCSLQAYSWYDANPYTLCTTRARNGASWLVSRRNVCFLRSLVVFQNVLYAWTFASYGHLLIFLNILCPWRLKQLKPSSD